MAVKKKARRHRHYTGNKKSSAAELSARLAPLEEHDARFAPAPQSQTDDTILLDTGKLKLPDALLEEENEAGRFFGLEPVILVILLVALAFIAFIAYLIYRTPPR